MSFLDLAHRRHDVPAARPRARAKHEAIIYYEGPLTKWERSQRSNHFEEHRGGVRIPIAAEDGSLMPEPNVLEVLQRKTFRFELLARVWIVKRLAGFDHSKIVGEVRRL